MYESESALTDTMSKEWWGGLQFPVTIFHFYTLIPSLVSFYDFGEGSREGRASLESVSLPKEL